MSRVLIIGLMTEGPTDVRFLTSIITRTFEKILFESESSVEIYDIQCIDTSPGNFVDRAVNAALQAAENGITILCIHTDADAKTDDGVFKYKITPALEEINKYDTHCKNIVAVVPVQMTESWMLADISLLKEEIMTDKDNKILGLTRDPESISDPKSIIKNAINIAQEDISKRRKRYELSISDIYLPLGQKISLEKLDVLPSYIKFKYKVRDMLKNMNYIKI